MKPYTGDATKIIVSFSMRDYGYVFATDLRDRLMKHFNYYSPTAVYQDNVTMRLEQRLVFPAKMPSAEDRSPYSGVTWITPDDRFKEAEGYMPIGAANNDWDKWYEQAMAEAQVMLMVITPAYVDPKLGVNCMKEWGQFEEMKARRGRSFRGITIMFPGGGVDCNAKPINSDKVEVFIARREFGPAHGLASNFGSPGDQNAKNWALTEDSFKSLTRNIKPYLKAA
jgi:hypothetical protein